MKGTSGGRSRSSWDSGTCASPLPTGQLAPVFLSGFFMCAFIHVMVYEPSLVGGKAQQVSREWRS